MFRIVCFMVLLSVSLYAGSVREAGTIVTGIHTVPPAGTDDYVITVLNDYVISYAPMVLGMDSPEDYLIFMSNESGLEKIYAADPSDLSYLLDGDLPWDTPDPFGTTGFSSQTYANDFNDNKIYYGSLFDFDQSFDDPYGADGRGMDSGDGYIWEAYGPLFATSGKVARFYPGGSGFEEWTLPGITSQLSGLTLYPIASSQGIAVTTYDSGEPEHYIWFYEFTGSECILLGSAGLPPCYMATGLTYSSYTGTWFCAFRDNSSEWHVIEFSVSEVSLEASSWGNIKSTFQ